MQMMPAVMIRPGILPGPARREDILPFPLSRRRRVLPGQRLRHMNTAQPSFHEDILHLFPRHHYGQLFRLLRPRSRGDIPQRIAQYIPVQEDQCIQRLVLGVRRDLFPEREIGEELDDFPVMKRCGMSLVMKVDISPNPLHIGLFRVKSTFSRARVSPCLYPILVAGTPETPEIASESA